MLTFFDSGPLIAFATGQADIAQRVWNLMNESHRTFASTALVRLEVLPKALYHGNREEAGIYESFFASVSQMLPLDEALVERALKRAGKLGLSALDCLHLEAAITLGAEEFITTEKPTKPLFRETGILVRNP